MYHMKRQQPLSFLLVILVLSCLPFLISGILDVTMVIDEPIVAYNEKAVMKCVAEEELFPDENSTFSVKVDIGTGTHLTKDKKITRIEPQPWPGRQLELLAEAGASKYGFFSCHVRNDVTNEKTTVTGLINSQNALLVPAKLSYSTSLNESITMAVIQPRRRSYYDLVWLQIDEEEIAKKAAQATLTLKYEHVTKDNAGVYMILYQVRDTIARIFQQGITNLLVRDCIEEKYGEGCLYDCPSCQNGAICDDKNGTCICPPGFAGELCEIECGKNKFGARCQHNCSEDEEFGCKNKLLCLPDPYGCGCATGYGGIFCDYDCVIGTYGASCTQLCHCIDDECDRFTGNCANGCLAGWTGTNCQVPCLNGTYGPNCNETCGFCSGGTPTCDRVTGACSESAFSSTSYSEVSISNVNKSFCLFGFEPPLCKDFCSNGTWDLDCKKKCHCKNNSGCNIESGFCEFSLSESGNDVLCDPGWRGDACNETCLKGYYGENCSEECGNCQGQEPCHHILGTCTSTEGKCEPGYEGRRCDEMCEVGFFGDECSYMCNCANGTECNHVTGECDGFCHAGFTGKNCHEQCPFGTFGLNCSKECGNCNPIPENRGYPLCDLMFGKCTAGCKKAWGGDKCLDGILCDQNPCFNDGTCVQSGEYYSCRCSKLYSGRHCEIRNPPCASSPCLNNGTCVEVNNIEFVCNCTEHFEGGVCDVNKKASEVDGVIENNGTVDNFEGVNNPDKENYDVDNDNVDKERKKDQKFVENEKIDEDLGVIDYGDDKNPQLIKNNNYNANDNEILIIVAMCLGVFLTLALVGFAYQVYFKNPSFSSVKPSPLILNRISPAKNQSTVRPVATSSTTQQPLYNEMINNKHQQIEIMEEIEPMNNKNGQTKRKESQPSRGSSTDKHSIAASDTIQEGNPGLTAATNQKKLSSSHGIANLNKIPSNPFAATHNQFLSNPPILQDVPSQNNAKHSSVFNTKENKRRIGRRKVKVRFSRSSLDRLDQITQRNFRESDSPEIKIKNNDYDKTIAHKADKQRNLHQGNRKSASKKTFTPIIYGVAQKDVNLFITTPRCAEEEFEMESRKGPIGWRENVTKSFMTKSKQN